MALREIDEIKCYATKVVRTQINNLSLQFKKLEKGVQIKRKEIVNRKTIKIMKPKLVL